MKQGYTHFYAQRSFGRGHIELAMCVERGNTVACATEVVFTQGDPDEMASVPTMLRIPEDAAQELMDCLWAVGIRPTEGSGSAGAMAATQKHLEDMRRLVFELPAPRIAEGR